MVEFGSPSLDFCGAIFFDGALPRGILRAEPPSFYTAISPANEAQLY